MAFPVRAQELSDAAKIQFFDQKVLGVLKENCFNCQGEKRLKGHFRVTSRKGLLEGGDIGPAINLNEPDKSLFLKMISYKDSDHEMPPKNKLPQDQIDILTQWVKMGAPFNPKHEIAGEAEHVQPNTQVNDRTRAYWAYQSIKRPAVPKVTDKAWSANAIDAFVHDRLTRANLALTARLTNANYYAVLITI